MQRQNLFADAPWGVEDADLRRRIFWRPDDARMGATLYELAPGYDGDRVHMHYGAEEMFFVLSGRPVFRNLDGEEELAAGDFLFCPEGRAGLHAFSNPHREAARILAMSAGRRLRLGGDASPGASAGRRSGNHRSVRLSTGPSRRSGRLTQGAAWAAPFRTILPDDLAPRT